MVNPTRQPIISLIVRGPNGSEQRVEAMLDTGFNGTLTLPPSLIQQLELPFGFTRTVMLADGTLHEVANHRGR